MDGEVPVQWGKNRRKWRLDTSISVTHVFTIVGVVVGFIIQIQDLKNQSETQARALDRLERVIERRDFECSKTQARRETDERLNRRT